MQMRTRAYQRRTRKFLLNMQRKRAKKKGSVLEKIEIRSFAIQSPSQATIFKFFTTSTVPVRMSGRLSLYGHRPPCSR